MKNEFISGIGKINHQNENIFFNLNKDIDKIEILSNNIEIESSIKSILNNEISEFYTSSKILELYKREFIESLEGKGIVTIAYTTKHPFGCFSLNYFDSEFNVKVDFPKEILFKICNNFKGKFSIITKPMKSFNWGQISNNSFENIMTSTQVIAFCYKNEENDYVWDKSNIYPDGLHVQSPLTSTEQYAQSCFEGMVAMVSENGNIFILRPRDNAKRLRESCIFLGIPPLNEEQIIESIKYAIISNKKFIPTPCSDEKLYIRPYVKGLEGGYGVGPAYSYVFVVELFPYGSFIGNPKNSLKLVTIEGKRRSHEGGMGSVKASGNYAQTIRDRQLAKNGEIPEYFGIKFDDVLYWGLQEKNTSINENSFIQTSEVLDEDAAGNIFFIRSNINNVDIYTPSLSRKSILGGFVRSTIIQIAKHLGYNVIEVDLQISDVLHMTGAFVTGSAIGLSKVKSIHYKGEEINFNTIENDNNKNNDLEVFNKLYALFYKLRKGDTTNLSDNILINYPYLVANLNDL